MSTSLDELKEIISKSNISLEDQNDLLVLLPVFPEHSILELNKVFKKTPNLIREFNRTLKARLRALTNGKDDEWDKIEQEMEQDRKELEELEKEEE